MAAATLAGSPATRSEAGQPDGVLLALVRLCRQLDRPVTEAELRAAATLPEGGVDLPCLITIAARLGFGVRTLRMSPRRLLATAPPFLILGRQPGEAWLVRARTHDQVVAGRAGRMAAPCHAAGQDRRGLRRPAGPPDRGRGAGQASGAREPLRGVRGVLWQIGLASVVINLLALATPLFMMTVYNKVINHAALQTLDVLAIGMVTLVASSCCCARCAATSPPTPGPGSRPRSAATWCTICVHLPYRFFEAMPERRGAGAGAPGRPAAPVPDRPPAAR